VREPRRKRNDHRQMTAPKKGQRHGTVARTAGNHPAIDDERVAGQIEAQQPLAKSLEYLSWRTRQILQVGSSDESRRDIGDDRREQASHVAKIFEYRRLGPSGHEDDIIEACALIAALEKQASGATQQGFEPIARFGAAPIAGPDPMSEVHATHGLAISAPA
jgi:hypothetical protein